MQRMNGTDSTMKLLYEFDYQNYAGIEKRMVRHAVRAIILRDKKIAMVFSPKEGYYKFPGGGVEKNESHLQALIRETKEESGLNVIPESVKAFGKIREIRKSTLHGKAVFDQTSFYYFAEVSGDVSPQALDQYEKELDYRLCFVDLQEALEVDRKKGQGYASSFILREAKVLELLLEKLPPIWHT